MSGYALNETKYGEILSKTLPRAIRNERDLEHFTQVLLELGDLARPTPEELEMVELLTILIDKYEADQYPFSASTPVEVMQFLMEQRGITAQDLAPIFGSKDAVSSILSGKRNADVTTAVKLGDFFHVAPELFIEWTTPPGPRRAAKKRWDKERKRQQEARQKTK